MKIRHLWFGVTAVALLGFASVGRAEELEALEPELSQQIAQQLSEKFEKEHADRQVKFEVDPSQAAGFHAGSDGLILVPIKGLKDGNVDPAVETECGAGLCYVFMSSCFAPLIDGAPADVKKLRSVKFLGPDGNDSEAICLLLSVKHVEGDDWRLLCFGKEKDPVIKAQFGEATDSADNALSMKVKGAKDQKADLAFTLFSKYAASFPIKHK
jgi:hypothetical protein